MKDGETVPVATVGDHVEIVLDRSPFYAEAGGQLGDHGRLIELRRRGRRRVRRADAGARACSSTAARSSTASSSAARTVTSVVDVARRKAISRAHTATHMIHRAFRERAGRHRDPDGLGERARTPALRLPEPDRRRARGAARGRAARQRGPHRRPRRVGADDDAGGGARDGRHGPLRREVRRPGARRVGRRLGARAVRRHACPALGPARRRDLPLRGLDRCRRAARRGARGLGRLPVPGARARARHRACRSW